MQAFDPSIIQIHPNQTPDGGLTFGMTAVGVKGTAYYRIPQEFKDFLKDCHEKHGVVGFEYDFEEGGFNFGVILKQDMEANPNEPKQPADQ